MYARCMSEFKNPFTPGDLLWFEDMLGPHGFILVMTPTMARIRIGDNVRDLSLKEALNTHLEHREQCSGPYRLAVSENWTAYDFGETRDV